MSANSHQAHDEDELERQRQIEKNQSVIALLDSWIAEPEATEEEIAEFREVMRSIDEHRDRKLFTEYLK